jgi:hypothetical protein
MDTPSKRRTIAVMAAVLVAVVFFVLQSGLLVVFGGILSMDGNVLAVAPGTGGEKEATVKLNFGPTVRASVPSACVVFAGQVATIHFTGPILGKDPSFRLWESRE